MEPGELAEAYIVAGVIPEKFRDDARHSRQAALMSIKLSKQQVEHVAKLARLAFTVEVDWCRYDEANQAA
ncbi:MAG TPA: hypothetical protein VFH55_13565 [Nitrospiria bacterium]|nr:hypothetical protein [Nitrospiria bacterium]